MILETPLPVTTIEFYVDNKHSGTFHTGYPYYTKGHQFYLNKTLFGPGNHLLIIVATYTIAGKTYSVHESHTFHSPRGKRKTVQDRTQSASFEPGDILVASDNSNGLPPGYMGHSAIVVDSEHIIESVPGPRSIRKVPIADFFEDHEIYAQYRPKAREMGNKAVQFAEEYLAKYEQNLKEDIKKPTFSFFESSPLDSQWESIYCSKLIWLSYNYGANYKFKNDFLWFAPQDLDEVLSQDENFELVYKHPDFKFDLDL